MDNYQEVHLDSANKASKIHKMDAADNYLAMYKVIVKETSSPSNRVMQFVPRPDDVIIAGHYKSGTMWMQNILHQIRTKGDDSFTDMYTVVPLLPDFYYGTALDLEADQLAYPRLFKSHAPFDNIPKVEGKTRFVVIFRHPYDAEFSRIKYMWRIFGTDRDVSPEEYLKIFAPEIRDDFATFICSWWSQRNNPNVLLVPYEDLKFDLRHCIQLINKFLNNVFLKESKLSKIENLCSYEYMKKNKEKFTADTLMHYWKEKANLQYKPLGSNVRDGGGQVGQGQQFLHESIRQHIDKRWSETIGAKYGVKNYDELYQQCSHLKNANVHAFDNVK